MFAVTMRGVGKTGKLFVAGEEGASEGVWGNEGACPLEVGHGVLSSRLAEERPREEEGEVKEGVYSRFGGPLFRVDRLGPLDGWGSSTITLRSPYS